MIEILTSTSTVEQAANQLFYYQNTTNQVQIIRLVQGTPQNFEKTIFPTERVLFYSTLDAILNVYNSTTAGLVLLQQVPCSQLQVIETTP